MRLVRVSRQIHSGPLRVRDWVGGVAPDLIGHKDTAQDSSKFLTRDISGLSSSYKKSGVNIKHRVNLISDSNQITMSEQEKSGGAISLTPQLEDVLKRICSNSKVEGVVVVNNEGIPIKSTLDSTSTVQARGGGSASSTDDRYS